MTEENEETWRWRVTVNQDDMCEKLELWCNSLYEAQRLMEMISEHSEFPIEFNVKRYGK